MLLTAGRRALSRRRLPFATVALLMVLGCAKSYVVTRPLGQPLVSPIAIRVGEITDGLPTDMPQEQKPGAGDLEKFRKFLAEEIEQVKGVRIAEEPGDSLGYEVRGSLLEYARGSGALRFFVGFGAGAARATTALELVDRESGRVVFSANLRGDVTAWETGDEMFRKIAAGFARELEKQLRSARGRTPTPEVESGS